MQRLNDFALHFQNGRFKIALVGDPHCTPNDPADRIKDYLSLQYGMIEREKPDLVILMGDNSGGENEEELRRSLLLITKPYAYSGTPFSFILGNHDLEYPVSDIHRQYAVYSSLPCCILPEDYDETGDYILLVAGEGGKPKLALHHVYSGSGGKRGEFTYYDHLSEGQLNALSSRQNALNAEFGPVPSVVFQHMCVQEEYDLVEKRNALCMLGEGVTGVNETKGHYYTLKKGVDGYLGEAPCPTAFPNDEFEIVKKTPGIFAMFFGHDHMNDFVGMTQGIILGQVKLSSFNAYGDGLMQGVRILEFDEHKPFTLRTRMLYFRDLYADDCRSIHGTLKTRRDKTSVKIETALRILPYAAGLAVPFLVHQLRKGRIKHDR